VSSNWIKILIWTAVVGVVFAYMWRQGQLKQVAAYVLETREELKKCSWPTWSELKGSTVVIAITIILLGGFTVVVDLMFNYIFFKHYFL
jgi:preprotein translocase subunit SecE